MGFQFLINILIMLLWASLQQSYHSSDLLIGFVIGAIIVYFLRGALNQTFYMRKVWALTKLVGLFIKELVTANYDMIKIVLNPRLNKDIKPGIIAVPTTLKYDWEITVLSMLVTLTPGTLTMDYSSDARTLYIHSMHVDDRQKVIDDITNSFERAIREVGE
ncbi:Na+/H+ antiporter subunit E [Geomicrobium sp. JCM 19038]|uniref:Na+/H+ antiporter subunit E n=1 Tax=Geomicrobium sp. JCM 19038 TaxID=1460635 RepID=UPI00045F128F|nr:Na+/H+ antiporter subunit E [Geomicrobium sp. JCM 19038]EZH67858.1 monovalent cation/H+ antiporter subunit E [Bacillaceae bacterium JMAK1]GAK06397.1 Na(+) H(+) antiporter subunit E [Geomicrobium sp. JCM 19038]